MKITKEKLNHLLRNPFRIFIWLITRLPYFKFIRETQSSNDPITFNIWFKQKILGYNKSAYWPVHYTSRVVGWQNISVGVGTNPGYNPSIYIQGTGKLIFGNYTTVGQNTGILSGGHDVYDHRILLKKETKIGSYCWIGMNSTILPGVVLGDNTVVAAGTVVTKSFPEGNCIIGGVPAKIIKKLDKDKFVRFEYEKKYIGYMKEEKFHAFRKKHLNV
ncbi:acyltransferase [Phaeodactylibacter xiamenensis]|uniref:acyltransferase n=1 Tax=Phaeodactylibacter xiamenensis TaxID=1524460 RepID=UPI0024A9E018|nr:acyltransferase [Phaeodactylibacter xiamenensis]